MPIKINKLRKISNKSQSIQIKDDNPISANGGYECILFNGYPPHQCVRSQYKINIFTTIPLNNVIVTLHSKNSSTFNGCGDVPCSGGEDFWAGALVVKFPKIESYAYIIPGTGINHFYGTITGYDDSGIFYEYDIDAYS